jgi:acetylornithine/N-succinyldiaminopimelate aminotransferase
MSIADKEHLMLHEQRPDLVMARGAGSWLWDEQGRAYLDFVQGWAANCLGHAPGILRDALAAQAAILVNASPAFFNRPQLALAAALARASGLDRVFFASTGAEANEGAVKLVRKWGRLHRGGASEVITAHGGFHGRTLAMMAASGKPGWDALFPPAVPGFRKVPFGDLAAVAAAIDEATAAVMVEPIQGEAGVVVPPAGYLAGLRRLTRERGVLLVLDEVQTGMGRTGSLFAFEAEGARPDVLTLGKGLGAGLPLAALLATREASCFAPGEQGGTFGGTPLVSAAGLAVLEALLAPGFLAGVRARGEALAAGLGRVADRFACPAVRGRGLLQALALPAPRAEAVVARAREGGLLVNAARPDLLRFMPALDVSEAEIDMMLERAREALRRRRQAGARAQRSARRSTLPTFVLGSSARNSTFFGTL